MREFSSKFYKSALWRKCRQQYIDSRIIIDGGLCETCHSRLGYIVHHKTWITPENINDPNVTLNQDNLKYDCLVCHNKESEKEEQPKYIFTDNGDVVKFPSPPHKNVR